MHFATISTIALAATASAASLSIASTGSIQSSTASIAANLISYLNPSTGQLPSPYFWWEAGGTLNGLLDYWHYTGDASHNSLVTTSLLANVGAGADFLGPLTDGNDDQGWWALTAMSAAEYNLPTPSGATPWLSIAQNVHGEMASRWDMTSCGGGLKWKITPGADGYDYKTTISNALFFQLSARLFRATGDQSYADWATKIFLWCRSVNLIDRDTWAVYDGTDDTLQCTQVDHDQWSYNVGVFLYGSAIMQTLSSDPLWATRTNGLLGATKHFFTSDGIMQETKCEPSATCNVDQLSFKAYLSRYMAATMVVLPSTQATILPLLKSSAGGAAASCGAGPDASTCGMKWNIDNWDGTMGVGQQLSGLEVVHGLLAVSPAKMAAREVSVDRRRKL
jgi:mannan endo-1,6-alpha-mannosidase